MGSDDETPDDVKTSNNIEKVEDIAKADEVEQYKRNLNKLGNEIESRINLLNIKAESNPVIKESSNEISDIEKLLEKAKAEIPDAKTLYVCKKINADLNLAFQRIRRISYKSKYFRQAVNLELFLMALTFFIIVIFICNDNIELPWWVFIWGLLGAIAYTAFSIQYNYFKGTYNESLYLYNMSRLIQGPILAGVVVLIFQNLPSLEETVYSPTFIFNFNQSSPELLQEINNSINQSHVQIHNNSVSNAQEPSQGILSVLSFFAGFFTNQTVQFLRGVVKRLIPGEPYKRAPVEKEQ